MAKDKKSFLLYVDLIHTIEKLTDEQAGKLFKHVLRYVNDKNPESDQFTEVVFEPIKQTLKRDLEKYEGIRQRNSENAKKRWNATACEGVPKLPALTKNADNDNVNVIPKGIYRAFGHLSINFTEYEKLLLDNTKTEIDEVLDAIENYNGSKKYTSLYLTAKKWLAKNKKPAEKEMIYDPIVEKIRKMGYKV